MPWWDRGLHQHACAAAVVETTAAAERLRGWPAQPSLTTLHACWGCAGPWVPAGVVGQRSRERTASLACPPASVHVQARPRFPSTLLTTQLASLAASLQPSSRLCGSCRHRQAPAPMPRCCRGGRCGRHSGTGSRPALPAVDPALGEPAAGLRRLAYSYLPPARRPHNPRPFLYLQSIDAPCNHFCPACFLFLFTIALFDCTVCLPV